MRVFLLLIALATAGNASAQMTICQNDVCTEELNGVKRTLSKEEVGKLQRANSRTAIGNIECRFASDPAACEKKLGEIFALFPY